MDAKRALGICVSESLGGISIWQQVASEHGLILVDTKYEMGLSEEGDILLIDELHTPDSSRYWLKEKLWPEV